MSSRTTRTSRRRRRNPPPLGPLNQSGRPTLPPAWVAGALGHRKIAIFGWLGFVVVAVLLGIATGTNELKQQDAIPGESGRATRLIDKEFGPKASETVLVQSTTLTTDDPAFRTAVGDVLGTLGPFTIVEQHRLAVRPRQRRADLEGRPFGARELRVQELATGREEDLEAGRGRGRRRTEGTSRADDRRVRRRQLSPRGRGPVHQGPHESGTAVDTAHAHHPAGHVRCARRCGHSIAAGAHLGARNDVPDCPAEPSHAGRRAGQRGDPADRARGRRRLLALLSQARTGGTGSRTQRVRCARGRSGDVRALGGHLRSHRHDRHGGHVLRRRSVVLVVRARHDHRRRDRDAGIAHGAAGGALDAR